MLETVSLNKLVQKEPFIGPLNFHERHGLHLPSDSTIMQHKHSSRNEMKINYKKTKIIPFTFTQTRDFIPELSFPGPGHDPLEVIYQTKLLGVIVSSELSWGPRVDFTVNTANRKMWQLVRFKDRGANQDQLLTLYHLKIRCILEFAAPVFHSSLTIQQSDLLEMIQKKCFAIILGASFKNYRNALKTLNQDALSTRRVQLCKTFAIKCLKNPRHSDLFPVHNTDRITRQAPTKFQEINCKTARYYNSAVPYMIRMLNNLY